MYWLEVAVLVLAIYGALKLHALANVQVALATFLEEQFKHIRQAQTTVEPGFPYGWFDEGWPIKKSDEEERAPLRNPELFATADEYSTQTWVAEYQSLKSATERRNFLRKLRAADIWMPAELLDLAYTDESAAVRAWAAAHLKTAYTDYIDIDHPVQTRDYEPAILSDPEPIVRAALWSNPDCQRLPFSRFDISTHKGWQEALRQMSYLERLGLMRNPKLSKYLVLALLEASTDELGISRKEHAAIVCSAALNPDLIGGSRFQGRDFWVVMGDPNSPFEEYGRMWDLCLDKWMGDSRVAYTFLTYIQTTPKKKLEVYTRLADADGDKHKALLREAVIQSCDPITDREVLKLAWTDSNEECRKAARERVGSYAKFVGVA
jgi:hypothetical protein